MNCDNPDCKNYTSSKERAEHKRVMEDLKNYLVSHEFDIEIGENDFGELTDIFKFLIGRSP